MRISEHKWKQCKFNGNVKINRLGLLHSITLIYIMLVPNLSPINVRQLMIYHRTHIEDNDGILSRKYLEELQSSNNVCTR
jgi:hypothetical protein